MRRLQLMASEQAEGQYR